MVPLGLFHICFKLNSVNFLRKKHSYIVLLTLNALLIGGDGGALDTYEVLLHGVTKNINIHFLCIFCVVFNVDTQHPRLLGRWSYPCSPFQDHSNQSSSQGRGRSTAKFVRRCQCNIIDCTFCLIKSL